ncbi:hypothetical protein ACFWOG_17075 [Kitasatospora sp. NPDC058406]|uniref:hypothetical protein n=1 Tax=Kitasatospora sp. NPDC058406 TaxID=3346483 RepID=UPI00365D460E
MNQHTDHSEPTTAPGARPSRSIREAAGCRARALTAPGGWLDRRRREVVDGLDDPAGAEPWVRAVAFLAVVTLAVLVLGTVGGILLNGAGALVGAIHVPQDLPADGDGLRAAITGPVHTYLAAHTPAPLTEATAYGAWKTVGLVTALLAFLTRGAVARAGWTAWSVASLAMVWSAADPAGRPVATGLTAAALTAASLVALRGLSFSLRPTVTTHTEMAPQITIQTPEPTPAPAPAPAPARLAALPNPGGPFDHRH